MITREHVLLGVCGVLMINQVAQTLAIKSLMNFMDRQTARYKRLHDSAMYLLSVVEANNIEFNEFDLIALKAILEVNVASGEG